MKRRINPRLRLGTLFALYLVILAQAKLELQERKKPTAAASAADAQ